MHSTDATAPPRGKCYSCGQIGYLLCQLCWSCQKNHIAAVTATSPIDLPEPAVELDFDDVVAPRVPASRPRDPEHEPGMGEACSCGHAGRHHRVHHFGDGTHEFRECYDKCCECLRWTRVATKPPLHLLLSMQRAVWACARQLAHGAKPPRKAGDWYKLTREELIDKLGRHVVDYASGKLLDDSGQSNLAAIMALAAIGLELEGKEKGDGGA